MATFAALVVLILKTASLFAAMLTVVDSMTLKTAEENVRV
jgi:hypothetical protein